MAQVTFNEILKTKVPGVYCEIDNSLANAGLPGKEAVGLLVGQKLAAGSLAYNTVSPLITSADQLIALTGEGSELHRMAIAWLQNNRNNRLYVICPDQTTGVAATKTIAVTTTTVKAGMINLYVAGQPVRITVEGGETADDIIEALVEAINANPLLPATATAGTGTVTLTAKHKGEAGNAIDLRLNYYQGETTAAGVTLTFANGTAAGAGNASLAPIIAAIGDDYYTDIVTSYTDTANIALLKAELTRRFGAMVNNESIAYCVIKGTLNEMLAKVDGINHQCMTAMMDYASPNMPEERAAAYAAVAAMQFQLDPARQIANLALIGDLPAAMALTNEERNMLLNAGVATIKTDTAGNTLIEREATTYRKNAQGAQDKSYFDLPTVKTVIYLRHSYVQRMLSAFPRHKLVNDDYPIEPGQDNIASPSLVAAELISLAKDWQRAGLVEDIDGFVKTLISVRDADDVERVNQLFQPNIVNNLRIIAGKLQFIS